MSDPNAKMNIIITIILFYHVLRSSLMCFTGGSSGFLSSLVCAISYNTRDDNALLYMLHSCMYVCMYVCMFLYVYQGVPVTRQQLRNASLSRRFESLIDNSYSHCL